MCCTASSPTGPAAAPGQAQQHYPGMPPLQLAPAAEDSSPLGRSQARIGRGCARGFARARKDHEIPLYSVVRAIVRTTWWTAGEEGCGLRETRCQESLGLGLEPRLAL